MFSKRLLLAGAAILALGACSHVRGPTDAIDPQIGEAIAWNKAVQTVNPDPVVDPNGAVPGAEGDKAAAAAKRYRSDQVKPVERIGTSSGGSGGGSSSGGGGNGGGSN